jgi:hypothetical protein
MIAAVPVRLLYLIFQQVLTGLPQMVGTRSCGSGV